VNAGAVDGELDQLERGQPGLQKREARAVRSARSRTRTRRRCTWWKMMDQVKSSEKRATSTSSSVRGDGRAEKRESTAHTPVGPVLEARAMTSEQSRAKMKPGTKNMMARKKQ
jgi:hypothetical protein